MEFIYRVSIFLCVFFLANSESALKLKEFRITAKDRMILYIDSSPVTLIYGRIWRQPDVIYLPENVQTIGVEVHARNSSFIKGGLIASSRDGFLNTDRRWLCGDIRKLKPVFTALDLKPAKEIASNSGKIQIIEIDSNAKWIWAADDHAPSIYCHFNIEHFQGVIKYKGKIPETSKESGDGQYEATAYQSGPPEPTSYQVLPELSAPSKHKEFPHTEIPKTDVETDYLSVITTVAKNGTDEPNRYNVLTDKRFQPLGKIDSSAVEVSQATTNDENVFESTESARRTSFKTSEVSTISHVQVTKQEDKLGLTTAEEFENLNKQSGIAPSVSETSENTISDNNEANLRESARRTSFKTIEVSTISHVQVTKQEDKLGLTTAEEFENLNKQSDIASSISETSENTISDNYEANLGEMWIAAVEDLEIYVNGESVSTFEFHPTFLPYRVRLPSVVSVVGVHAVSLDFNRVGIVSTSGDGQLDTNERWKCTNVNPGPNWEKEDFDDSHWPPAKATNKNCAGGIKRDVEYLMLKKKSDASKTQYDTELDSLNGKSQAYDSQEAFNHHTQSNFKGATESSIKNSKSLFDNSYDISSDDLEQFTSGEFENTGSVDCLPVCNGDRRIMFAFQKGVNFQELHKDVVVDSNKAFPCIETLNRKAWWISTENVLCTETCEMFCRLKFSHFEMSVLPYETPPSKSQQSLCGCAR